MKNLFFRWGKNINEILGFFVKRTRGLKEWMLSNSLKTCIMLIECVLVARSISGIVMKCILMSGMVNLTVKYVAWYLRKNYHERKYINVYCYLIGKK